MKYTILAFSLFIFCFANGQIPAFPGAEGFGTTTTTGGRGGTVYYVTNLNCSGPGSLNYGLSQSGARYILFKVSGIIDCAAEIEWGNCYIAGQTSPGGITVRGILLDDYYEPSGLAQNVIIRHLNSRPSTEDVRPGTGWVMDDALRLDGASNVVVDHCSFANAIDECIQLSRSSNITISNCQLAETLGGHFYLGGMLMNYSTTAHPKDNVSIHHNIWNRIGGRMPEISCEPSAESPGDNDCLAHPFRFEFSNNLLWDMPIQVYYEPVDDFLIEPNFIGNRCVARASYGGAMFHHPMLDHSGNELFADGNTMNLYPSYSDYELFYCCNDFNLYNPNPDNGVATLRSSRFGYPGISYTPTGNLEGYIFENVGAFNAHSSMGRDSMNRRLMKFINNNSIDPQPVDGEDYYHDAFLLDFTTPPAAPTDTDNDGMPNAWENLYAAYGLDPNVADHNGTQLSVPLTGVAGYTNLECYLNLLAEGLVSGSITLATELVDFKAIPIAAERKVLLRWTTANEADNQAFIVEHSTNGHDFDGVGQVAAQNQSHTVRYELLDENLRSGLHYYRLVALGNDGSREVFKTVSVKLVSAGDWLRLRRNVSEGTIEVQVMDELRLPVRAVLYDVNGRTWRDTTLQNGQGSVDVSGLPSGVYFLQVWNDYLRHSERVLVGDFLRR
ncbi:MAG: T9SS type A sorting domain-containing protein [Saprospiraceae bacterium]|nr:T9SS type A sorting domain-containing protein [Saprospiraceae bacterium]